MSYIPTEAEVERLNMIKSFITMQLELKGFQVKDVGSTAKGTWISGKSDIDLYIYGTTGCEHELELIQHLFPDGHIKHGQLTIWNVEIEGYDIDMVLVNKDFSKREDTTKHAEYFNTHLTNEMRNEVRLAKAYLRSRGVYGAEIGGIVGVAIETLILNKGTFMEVCKLLATAKPNIQDPTMKADRNLLASITSRKWRHIQDACMFYILNIPTVECTEYTVHDFITSYEGKADYIIFNRKDDKALDFQALQSTANKVVNQLRNLEHDLTIETDVYADDNYIAVVYMVHPKEFQRYKEVKVPIKYGDGFKRAHPEAVRLGEFYIANIERKIHYPAKAFEIEVVHVMTTEGYTIPTKSITET